MTVERVYDVEFHSGADAVADKDSLVAFYEVLSGKLAQALETNEVRLRMYEDDHPIQQSPLSQSPAMRGNLQGLSLKQLKFVIGLLQARGAPAFGNDTAWNLNSRAPEVSRAVPPHEIVILPSNIRHAGLGVFAWLQGIRGEKNKKESHLAYVLDTYIGSQVNQKATRKSLGSEQHHDNAYLFAVWKRDGAVSHGINGAGLPGESQAPGSWCRYVNNRTAGQFRNCMYMQAALDPTDKLYVSDKPQGSASYARIAFRQPVLRVDKNDICLVLEHEVEPLEELITDYVGSHDTELKDMRTKKRMKDWDLIGATEDTDEDEFVLIDNKIVKRDTGEQRAGPSGAAHGRTGTRG